MAILLVLETAILSVVGGWTLIGLVVRAFDTGGTMDGLLTMLHEKWRGAVILGVLLFYRTLRDSLDRLEWRNVKTPLGEVAVRSEHPVNLARKEEQQ